jgi:hypothetical protein
MRATVTCNTYIDNACLVVGSQAADYAPLHPADDLARCLRYYEVYGAMQNEIYVTGYQSAGNLASGTPYGLKARKAVSPTVTKNGTWNLSNCAQPTVLTSAVDSVTISSSVTALGTFNFNNNAVGANVTIEANP